MLASVTQHFERIAMDTTQSAETVTKPVVKERWQLVPVDLDDDMGEAIAGQARCCGGIAFSIWSSALEAAPVHPLSQNPHGVERMKVCRPGYLGPANLEVVDAGDYDALLALLDDPDYPTKHARRLIAELRAQVAELQVDKERLDHIEANWFCENYKGGLSFARNESWSTPDGNLRGAIDEEIKTGNVCVQP
jgi:hypothetical protein